MERNAVDLRRRIGNIKATRTGIAWGLVDQSLSSITNLLLAVIAGRWLGPTDLGVVSIGFSYYVIALMLLRALITDPAIVLANAKKEDRHLALTSSVTLTVSAGAAVVVLSGAFSSILRGPIMEGMILFAPWIVPALLQDFWRFALFSSGHRFGAVLNDGLWLATMLIVLPLSSRLGEPWAIVGAWGSGATVASLVGFVQTRAVPRPVRASMRWWQRDAAPLGRWLAVESGFLALGSHGAFFLLAIIIAPSGLGGLRAVQSIFAPITLIGPAITLPGLPALTASFRQSPKRTKVMAGRLSIVAVALIAIYICGILLVSPARLLAFIYGEGFSDFANLIVPVAIAQLGHGAAAGYIVFLKAGGEGKALAWARAAGTIVGLALAGFLAMRNGVLGAAWGLTGGVLVSTVLIMLASRRIAGVHASRSHARLHAGTSDVERNLEEPADP
jgi:O-antigen/teichoic acid export membrane protein